MITVYVLHAQQHYLLQSKPMLRGESQLSSSASAFSQTKSTPFSFATLMKHGKGEK